jgi:iron complex outermembrane receptor protein
MGKYHICFLHVFFLSSCFFYSHFIFAQEQSIRVTDIPPLTVEGSTAFSNNSELNIGQRELQNRFSGNIADSLNDQLGFSSSSFGQSSNRPIIRGMSGYRAPTLQNGMNSGDVSSVSPDHAVASEVMFSQAIELLRGGESLRYSSGANQGLINVVDQRIPSTILAEPSASLLGQYNLNQRGLSTGILAEDSIGNWTLHVDNTSRHLNDYQRPDGQTQPYSFTRQNDFGVGASYFRASGFTGLSFSQFQNLYGIPSQEGSQIDLFQTRFSVLDEESNPFAGISKLKSQFTYTNYKHQEISNVQTPESEFKNKSYEARLELFHHPYEGWNGSFGFQAGSGTISASDLTNPNLNAAIIPSTTSTNFAMFAVENKSFGQIDVQQALRYEWIKRSPDSSIPYTDNPNFDLPTGGNAPLSTTPSSNQFSLISLSSQAAWNYSVEQAILIRYSFTQRAPGVDELYSFGNHDATATFDVGNNNLNKESSNHFEMGWRKNKGLTRAKLNLYQDFISNFIYTQYTGATDQNSGFPVRQFLQANAIIKGIESEITYNLNGDGFSGRIFGDYSEGTLDQGGYLPLQPATRIGGAIYYNRFGWKSNLSFIHAFGQYKTATSTFYNEPSTAGYNKLDFRLSKSQAINRILVTYYLQANNLLNDTIRFSTTVDTLRMYAPQPGRTFILGIKVDY